MSILVLESNPAQVETIRDIVCNVLGTELTLVDSIERALEALQTTTPDLVLLPALVSAEEEAKLMSFLRQDPKGAHIETLFTPLMARKDTPTETTRGWLRWVRPQTASDVSSSDEVTLFTERLTWSLQSARERRQLDDELNALADSADERNTPNEPVMSVQRKEGIAPEAVVESAPALNVAAADPAMSLPKSHSDRRMYRRFYAHELQALRDSRVAGGPCVNVRDVSASGALLESDAPLGGDFGVLVLTTAMSRAHYVPFRVVRHRIENQGSQPRHVEACAFLEPLDISDLRGPEASMEGPHVSGQAPDERRRHVRVDGPFHGCRRGHIDMPVMLHNLSQGGCFVDSRLPVDPGRALTIGLRSVDGKWIDVSGEVVHNQPGLGFAVRFVELSETVSDVLARIVAQGAAGVDARETTAA
jgi:hypothetical protein